MFCHALLPNVFTKSILYLRPFAWWIKCHHECRLQRLIVFSFLPTVWKLSALSRCWQESAVEQESGWRLGGQAWWIPLPGKDNVLVHAWWRLTPWQKDVSRCLNRWSVVKRQCQRFLSVTRARKKVLNTANIHLTEATLLLSHFVGGVCTKW